MVAAQTSIIETLQRSLDDKSVQENELQEENKRLREQVDYLLKKHFGPSSEKRMAMPQQLWC